MQQEQFREAMIEYKHAVRAASDNPSLQWQLAKAALKGGAPSTAHLALGRVVHLDPSHFGAKWSLGDLYLAGGKMDEVGGTAEGVGGYPKAGHIGSTSHYVSRLATYAICSSRYVCPRTHDASLIHRIYPCWSLITNGADGVS